MIDPAGEDDVRDLYENAPCGLVSTSLDGYVVEVNTTLLGWLGRTRTEVVGRRFTDLLTVGGRIHHETHVAPLLRLQGRAGEIAVDVVAADGTRQPVLMTSAVTRGPDGEPWLVRSALFDARGRRSYERELLRARREADAAAETADHERARVQRLASILQRSLLPPALPAVPGLTTAAHYHPASADEVGGDFYDLFPLDRRRWGFFLGDVCGKGPGAAALTSLTRYTLRSAAVHDTDPAEVLRTLNTVLQQERPSSRSTLCTVVFGVLDPAPGHIDVTLVSGGHPPALLLTADGTCTYRPTPDGQVLGVLPDPVVTTTELQLHPGDTLLLYSDGIIEARLPPGGHGPADEDRYDEEALHAFLSARSPASPAVLVAHLVELIDALGDGVEDDVAVLALGVPPDGGPPR